jgi:ADP-heptose:LPS heptosyltransferase
MNVDLVRRIDKFIGIPLCFLLTVCRKLFFFLTHKDRKILLRRVLIIKLSEMGSTVLAYPAFLALKRANPEIQLYFLVFDENKSVLEVLDVVNPENIYIISGSSPWRFILDVFRTILVFRRIKIDTTIDFDFFSRFSAIFAFLTGAPNRVGFHRYTCEGLYRGDLLTHRVLYSPHIHTSEAFMALVLSALEPSESGMFYQKPVVASSFTFPEYKPSASEVSSVRSKMEKLGLDLSGNTRIVIINPNSSQLFPLRRWPVERFVQTALQLLKADSRVRIVITGSASEREEASKMMNQLPGAPVCVNMAGYTTFRELLALYSISSLMITNDSGPAHFASLVSLPAIVLFGPETPRLYSPAGKHSICLYSGFACSPCVSVYNAKKSPCKRSLCLEAISVEDVVKRALEVIK